MIFLLLITVLFLAALFLLLFLGESRFDLLLRFAKRLLSSSQRFL